MERIPTSTTTKVLLLKLRSIIRMELENYDWLYQCIREENL